jgi:hypothetical protein
MNLISRIAVTAVTLGALLVSACVDAARKPEELLQYIPADTPYVLAVTKPLPDDLMDKFEPAIDSTLSAYRDILDFQVEEMAAKLAEEEGGAEKAAEIRALANEFGALLSMEGLRNAGFDRDSLFAVYGDGLLPVMRLALVDQDSFEATVARIEAKSSEKFLVGELGRETYRYRDFDKIRLIVATPGTDVVVTLVPTTYSDQRLEQTLGLDKPRQNLERSKELRKIAREYGFTDHLISFVDVERVAASFLGDPSGLNAELFSMVEYDPSQLTAECKAEFAEIAAIAPRVVMGYTEVNKNFLETEMIVELRDDIATGLATLPAAVPGLGVDLGGLFTFGFSLDPLAARSFYEARLDAMEEDPYKCEALAELQASTAKGREALAKPLPPVVYSFRGMLANVTDMQGMDIAADKPPESVDAAILLAMENAQDLVAMAAMMSPEVAALNLLPDGEAKPLELPQLATIAEQAFAALSSGALSVSIGAGADEKAEAMLEADVQSPMPFMSFSMDSKRYYEFISDAVMQQGETEDGEPMPPEMRNAIRDIMVSSGDIYERITVNVHLTERGIEIGSRITLSN